MIIIYLIGIVVEIIWLVYVKFSLNTIDILQYMLYSIGIPVVIVALTSFLYSLKSHNSTRKKYICSVINSVIMASVLTIFCMLFINSDVINTIMNNTITSENVQVSISLAKAGDNVQSYLIFIAIGGLGTLLGNKFGKKKVIVQDEYDD
ncbi:MAG: hypothetical protein J6O60_04390 [Lachnospiraceae bacterium]|nr:hypothetical protein [Lachnospiraceae bacterium]